MLLPCQTLANIQKFKDRKSQLNISRGFLQPSVRTIAMIGSCDATKFSSIGFANIVVAGGLFVVSGTEEVLK